MTRAEIILWEEIRLKKMGVKFRNQHPVYRYILDFYCHELKLGIEVDGRHHREDERQRRYDEHRDFELSQQGLTIIRFSNNQVYYGLTYTVNQISKTIKALKNSRPL